MPPGRAAEPGSAPGGIDLRHRTRRLRARGRCHAPKPGGLGRVGSLCLHRHSRGSAGLHRPAPSRGDHSGTYGVLDRRSASCARPGACRRGSGRRSLPGHRCRDVYRRGVPSPWGRRVILARTRTCGPTRDAFGVLDRRSVSPRKPRRQSPWCLQRGVLPGQCCRVADRRGAPFVVRGPAGPGRPELDLWRPRGPRTGEELAGAGCRAQPGVTHRGLCCACLAPGPHRRTVDRPGHRCQGAAGRVPGLSRWSYPGRERSSGSPERTTK